MDIKIKISKLAKEAPPKVKQQVSLKERVEYAIDCIRCEAPNKARAIEFLRVVNDKLQKHPKPSEELKIIMEQIKPVIDEYGTYHLGFSDNG